MQECRDAESIKGSGECSAGITLCSTLHYISYF